MCIACFYACNSTEIKHRLRDARRRGDVFSITERAVFLIAPREYRAVAHEREAESVAANDRWRNANWRGGRIAATRPSATAATPAATSGH